LLLHGVSAIWRAWTPVLPYLEPRHDVIVPTLLGHGGGSPLSPGVEPSVHALVDGIEAELDALGLQKVHIVGNSLGGWAAFELERRGRARSLTAIAPAGGWTRYSPTKFETVGKFLLGGPALLLARLLGPRILDLPFARRLATLPISGPADGPSQPDLLALMDDATHCPAYFQLLVRTLLLPGLAELANASAPTQLVLCEKDRVFPSPRGNQYFTTNLPPGSEVIRLDGVGHIPMLEAPGRVSELIAEFVDQNTEPRRLASPAG
ncbi:MAG: hypothetical protein QOK12_2147, partial [Mycobacterium sp.]|nr:hypothetical protein [Mycobacterium sp.]